MASDPSTRELDEMTAKLEELEPYLGSGSFWPRSPAGRRLAGFFAFNALGGGLLAAYKLGGLDPSLVFWALAAHAVGIGFFFAWALAVRKVARLLKELSPLKRDAETRPTIDEARARWAKADADLRQSEELR